MNHSFPPHQNVDQSKLSYTELMNQAFQFPYQIVNSPAQFHNQPSHVSSQFQSQYPNVILSQFSNQPCTSQLPIPNDTPQFPTQPCTPQLPIPIDTPQFPNQPSTPQLSIPVDASSKKKAKKKRGGCFSIEEDNHLCNAWLNTSLDAVAGNEQKKETFWTRVSSYLYKYKQFTSEPRINSSLSQRWGKINKEVGKFVGIISQINHRSGSNEQTEVMDAKMMYQNLHKKGKPFAFEHCWLILRFQPKWLSEYEQKNQTKSRKRKNSPTPPDIPIDLEDLEADEVPKPSFIDLERPLGRKSEKQMKREQNADVPVVEVLEGIREDNKVANAKKEKVRNELMERRFADNAKKLELIAERVKLDKEKQKLDKEKQQLEQKREDERIMLIDTSRLEPLLKQYYIRRQEEIING